MVNSLASPKIRRSDILLGVVVLVAVIMSVALFLSQLPGFADNPNGSDTSSLEIIDLAKDADLGTLIVYVENIGIEVVNLGSGYDITVNDIEIPLVEGSIDKNVLEKGQIATVDLQFKVTPGISLVVRIIADNVILAESIVTDTDELQNAYALLVNIQGDSSKIL